jgi:hypothetical protein
MLTASSTCPTLAMTKMRMTTIRAAKAADRPH